MITMWALIQSGTVSEITDTDPQGRFHPSLVWVACGPDVTPGDIYENGEFSKPVPPTPTAEEIRALRNTLLQQSDFSQLSDSPVDSVAWATYRQALRDITEQTGFPEVVEWPIKPEQP